MKRILIISVLLITSTMGLIAGNADEAAKRKQSTIKIVRESVMGKIRRQFGINGHDVPLVGPYEPFDTFVKKHADTIDELVSRFINLQSLRGDKRDKEYTEIDQSQDKLLAEVPGEPKRYKAPSYKTRGSGIYGRGNYGRGMQRGGMRGRGAPQQRTGSKEEEE